MSWLYVGLTQKWQRSYMHLSISITEILPGAKLASVGLWIATLTLLILIFALLYRHLRGLIYT